MTNKTPEALIHQLESWNKDDATTDDFEMLQSASALIRRQQQRIEALEKALKRLCTHAPRTSQQIDADWDAARALLSTTQQEDSQS
ncbi:hypothetical protein OU995_11705 [Roseateles sp. SL47]|uniref:hypothetical protein n=1 Tax=Roseateles sp. SL47 TaxID=2995138 RepID=UPI00226E1F20|nr:hypothetical protein [Roseateles sp. SL47]WAC75313.1 hypothetical protein OU995_11705 [Roseateles sp. SL47]